MKPVHICRSVLCLSLCVVSVTGQAADNPGWTTQAGLGFTNDYVFRGVSQSSGTAAVSAGLGVTHASGFHAGLWGSSIGFAHGLELDPSAGFGRSLGALDYDITLVHYDYPGRGSASLSFNELQGSLAWKGVSLSLAWSNDFTGGTGASLYTHAGYGLTVHGWDLAASVGQSRFHDAAMSRFDGYVDYQLSLGKAFAGLDFTLAWADSNLHESECSAFIGEARSCSGRVVFSVSKSL